MSDEIKKITDDELDAISGGMTASLRAAYACIAGTYGNGQTRIIEHARYFQIALLEACECLYASSACLVDVRGVNLQLAHRSIPDFSFSMKERGIGGIVLPAGSSAVSGALSARTGGANFFAVSSIAACASLGI